MGSVSKYRRGRLVALAVGGAVALVAVGAALAQTSASGQQAPAPAGGGKVTICHKGKNTLTVSVNAWPAHEAHGDARTACAPGTASKTKPPRIEDDEDETDERSTKPRKAKPKKGSKSEPDEIEPTPQAAPHQRSERPAVAPGAKKPKASGKPSWAGPPGSRGNRHGGTGGRARGHGGK